MLYFFEKNAVSLIELLIPIRKVASRNNNVEAIFQKDVLGFQGKIVFLPDLALPATNNDSHVQKSRITG
jgi:hypothetical protein